jgi:hypothetical protein
MYEDGNEYSVFVASHLRDLLAGVSSSSLTTDIARFADESEDPLVALVILVGTALQMYAAVLAELPSDVADRVVGSVARAFDIEVAVTEFAAELDDDG